MKYFWRHLFSDPVASMIFGAFIGLTLVSVSYVISLLF